MGQTEQEIDLFVADVAEAVLRAKWRETQLTYVLDMRAMLGGRASVAGEPYQSWRDRWSHLCRRLCVDGKPVLSMVHGGVS